MSSISKNNFIMEMNCKSNLIFATGFLRDAKTFSKMTPPDNLPLAKQVLCSLQTLMFQYEHTFEHNYYTLLKLPNSDTIFLQKMAHHHEQILHWVSCIYAKHIDFFGLDPLMYPYLLRYLPPMDILRTEPNNA